MSVESNTYEELTIRNVNEKTKILAASVSEYLLKTWGITDISLTVDGINYESSDDESIEEGSKLYEVCIGLPDAKEIFLRLRSTNNGGASWRLESGFMQYLNNDDAILSNVVYRSTDYYDTDSGIEMYLYNENGLQNVSYDKQSDCISDITEWYCYTPTLHILDEEQMDNTELHSRIFSVLTELCILFGIDEDDIEDWLEDDWEDCGEIILSGSIRFTTDRIPAIISLARQLADIIREYNISEFELGIYAVPDGENDYDFASFGIEYTGDDIQDLYCRY